MLSLDTCNKSHCCHHLKLIYKTILVVLIILLGSSISFARHKRSQHGSAEPIIRVKLGKIHKKVVITFSKGGVIKNARGRVIRRFRRKKSFKWVVSKKRHSRYNNKTLKFQSKNSILKLNSKSYRGSLIIKFTRKGAIVVNHIGIEDYVKGVVGSEIGSTSPLESLKAQAVIARTYAYANKNRHGKDNADVCDSNHCQVYSGISAERVSIDKAVDSTKGIIMISDSKPISALYFATCGGQTSDNDKVWGGAPKSYLRRVKCPFCKKGTNYRWSRKISVTDLRQKLQPQKIRFSKLFSISFKSPSHFDRVDYVILKTDRGNFKVKGTTFRRIFNLPSTTFLVAPAFKVTFVKKKPIKKTLLPAKMSSINKKTKFISVKNLSSNMSLTPKQLTLYSAKGLQRVIRPKTGWKVIVYRQLKPMLKLKQNSTILSEFTKIERIESITPKINRHTGLKNIELYGRGYGHQVGLCQSGAIEMGRENWSYRQILAYYYSNVALRHLKY